MLILLILVILLFGSFGGWYFGQPTQWGPTYGYGGGLGFIVLLIVLLILFGRGRF